MIRGIIYFFTITCICFVGYLEQQKYSLPETVPQTFQPYVKDFIKGAYKHKAMSKEIQEKIDTLTIELGDPSIYAPNKKISAICLPSNTVVIHEMFWKNAPHHQKQMLMDHELGHCILGRVHRHSIKPSQKTGFRPQSLMFSSIFSGEMYLAHKEELRQELFNQEHFHKLEDVQRNYQYKLYRILTLQSTYRVNFNLIQVEIENQANNENISPFEYINNINSISNISARHWAEYLKKKEIEKNDAAVSYKKDF